MTARKPKRKGPKTPIRGALLEGSPLAPQVKDGLGALIRKDRDYIDEPLRSDFADSLALDVAMHAGHEQDNRWDYLLGHGAKRVILALEPHSAKDDEISTVIKKREQALLQLRDHARPGVRVVRWYWVASGNVAFSDLQRTHLRLAQNGIKFVGKRLQQKHLP